MCVVSVMVDTMQQQWPPIKSWPPSQVIEINEILERVRRIDEKEQTKDCHDPKKDKFLQELEARIQALEDANAISKRKK